MSTPNMGLTLPTDKGSADTWDSILDTVFAQIDSHDHTTGKGVQVPSAALKINADVSWSFGGTSRAITDINALDFKAATSTSVSALAGALFVSDGSGALTANELYWRTTGGVNVKLTAGSALNVAAFTGGFGGDYAAAGALALFDDATDSYWFQQQVGASVRQYARMRSADVDLYEFKANPAAGPPTNRVRLASPAALAASYSLTFPGALPTGKAAVTCDSAGVLTFGTPVSEYAAGFALPINATGTPTFDGDAWTISANGGLSCPIVLAVGSVFSGWKVYLQKGSNAATILNATMSQQNMSTGAVTAIGATQTNSANAPGLIQLTSATGTTVLADCSYRINILGGPGSASDLFRGWSVSP